MRQFGLRHTCHWPGCTKFIPPKLWGCKIHWFALPASIRARIWATFRDGQEHDKRPSKEYLQAAQEAKEWVLKTSGPVADLLTGIEKEGAQ